MPPRFVSKLPTPPSLTVLVTIVHFTSSISVICLEEISDLGHHPFL